METIIESLKKGGSANAKIEKSREALLDELSEAQVEIKELEEENQEMQDTYIIPDISVSTSLGRVHIKNEKGNMQLQMEIDDFVEELKRKYT